MENKFKILIYASIFVDINRLNEGIYGDLEPSLMSLDTTKESILLLAEKYRAYIGYTEEDIKIIEDNLKMCQLVDCELVINK